MDERPLPFTSSSSVFESRELCSVRDDVLLRVDVLLEDDVLVRDDVVRLTRAIVDIV